MPYHSANESAWGLEFGYKLRTMIDNSGLTQAEIAERIGVSRQIFSRYVHGTAIPSIYKVTQIANIIGCTIDDLTKF